MMHKKSWYLSKTIWLNALVVTLATIESSLNILQPILPVNFYAIVAFALPVLNVFLRTVTHSGVSK